MATASPNFKCNTNKEPAGNSLENNEKDKNDAECKNSGDPPKEKIVQYREYPEPVNLKWLPWIHLNHFFNCEDTCIVYRTFRNHFKNKGTVNTANLMMIPSGLEVASFVEGILCITCYEFTKCEICLPAIYHVVGNDLQCNCNTRKEYRKNQLYVMTFIYKRLAKRISGNSKDCLTCKFDDCVHVIAARLTKCNAAFTGSARNKNIELHDKTDKIKETNSDQNFDTEENNNASVISESESDDETESDASGLEEKPGRQKFLQKLLDPNYKLMDKHVDGICGVDEQDCIALRIHAIERTRKTMTHIIDNERQAAARVQMNSQKPPLSAFIRCSGHTLDCLLCREQEDFNLKCAEHRRLDIPDFCKIKDDCTTCKKSLNMRFFKKRILKKKYIRKLTQTTKRKRSTRNKDKYLETICLNHLPPDIKFKNRPRQDQQKLADYRDFNICHIGNKDNTFIKKSWLREFANGDIAVNEIKSDLDVRKNILRPEENWEKKFCKMVNEQLLDLHNKNDQADTNTLLTLSDWIISQDYYKLCPTHL